MANKQNKAMFVCGECGYECGKWMGKCPACGSWNTIVEVAAVTGKAPAHPLSRGNSCALPLKDVQADASKRYSCGIAELDRVLGGGLVMGSVVLLGGDPGIGKSTLLMQAASGLCALGPVLYVTGEESAAQLKLRASRLQVSEELMVLAETDLASIELEAQRLSPAVLIIDSIQTMYNSELPNASGSVSQIREVTSMLVRYAKATGCAVFIVGHVTKEGAIAGPRMLEHMVDTVLYFEGDRQDAYRLLRAVKNRFGSTDEIGVFEMRDNGMAEISDPSSLFLSGAGAPGCAVTCVMEGTRPILAEVQALLASSAFSNPRRMASGIDFNRLALLLAVLEKKAELRFVDKDVYVNVVGGLRLNERAGDLAVALCIASAQLDISIPPTTAFLGEISLTGEIRNVNRLEKRVQECARLGFSHVFIPACASCKTTDVSLVRVKTVGEALRKLM